MSSFMDLFQKKRKYATIPSESTKREIPEGLMNKCPKCGTIQFSMELEKSMKVCSSCGYHFVLNGVERIQMTLDEGQLVEYDADMISENPLNFPGYEDKIAQAMEKTGFNDGVITGEGAIGGFPVIFGVMSFEFFTGTLGSVVGEKITRMILSRMYSSRTLLTN